MVNAQEYLDQNYPLSERKEIKELNLNYKDLVGTLDLSDFSKLEELDCSSNNLTDLITNNCVNLVKIVCHNNKLINLDISNNENLTELYCGGNKSLNTSDVSKNSKLTILECY